MKRFLFALFAVATIGFSSGCYGWYWPHWGWHGPGFGAPGGAPGQVMPGQAVPQGSYYQGPASPQSVQMGVPQPVDGPVTAVPGGYPAHTVPRTAAMPLESLPTY